jgi:hypothetical protein
MPPYCLRAAVSRCISLRLLAVFICAQEAPAATRENPYYSHEVLAQSGGAFTGFESAVSINSLGQLAFIGQLAGTGSGSEGVYRASAPGAVENLSDGFASANRDFGAFLQINDQGMIVARERVQGIPPSYFIRTWPDKTIIARSGSSYDSVTVPAINNAGEVAFIGLTGGSKFTTLNLASTSGTTLLATYTGVFATRPVIDGGGNAVIRDPLNRLVMWDRTGTIATVIASSTTGFSSIGMSPGTTQDGRVVVFCGDRGNGPGIFASIAQGSTRKLFTIAGENNAPGASPSDLGRHENGASIFFQNFALDSRVGVVGLPPTDGWSSDGCFVVCFMATPNAPRKGVIADLPCVAATQGIFMTRVDYALASQPQIARRAAIPVAQEGDEIGGAVVTGLAMYDPIASVHIDAAPDRCAPTQLDHRIAFWAQTGASQLIVRANPKIAIYPAFRQFTPWGTELYADDEYGSFTASRPDSDPQKAALLEAKPRYNLRAKGCALTSYAMSLNSILNQVELTPVSIPAAVPHVFTPIKRLIKFVNGIPKFDGADVNPSTIQQAFRVQRVALADDAAIARAHQNGWPVMMWVHNKGHWVVSKGIAGCAPDGALLFDIVDPGSAQAVNNGPLTKKFLKFSAAFAGETSRSISTGAKSTAATPFGGC